MNDVLPELYADNIDVTLTVICQNNGVNDMFHVCMISGYIDIEHESGITASLFKRLSVKHTWHLLQICSRVCGKLFAIYFMVNIYTCVCGKKSSAIYMLVPPRVKTYLDVDVNDMYDDNDTDELMITHLALQT